MLFEATVLDEGCTLAPVDDSEFQEYEAFSTYLRRF